MRRDLEQLWSGSCARAHSSCKALRRAALRAIPVYPHYPYKAGHYPTTEAYYDLPPYVDIKPNFYRWRYFLMAQERNRYRYVPHIFHRFDAQRYE